MTKIDPNLFALLTSDEHLATALELQNQMAVIRETAAQYFSDQVVKFLMDELSATGVSDKWVAERQNSWNTSVQIRPIGLTDVRRGYSFVASGVVQNEQGWYGWRWPQRPFDYRHPDSRAEAELAQRMTSVSGGKTDGEAMWFRVLRDGAGAYALNSTEDMVRVIDDNRSADHLLAKAIANELRDAFLKWKDEVVRLPSFVETVR